MEQTLSFFLIDSEKFRCHLIEKIVKDKNCSIYSTQSPEESLHLIVDLKPTVLLIELPLLLLSSSSTLMQELQHEAIFSSMTLIGLGTPSDSKPSLFPLSAMKGFIPYPIHPSNFWESLQHLLPITL